MRRLKTAKIAGLVFAAALGAHADTGVWHAPEYPVPVLHLEGSIEEVAALHGRIAKATPGGTETLEYLGRRAEYLLKSRLVTWIYRKLIRDVMWSRVPETYQAAFDGLAAEAGVDAEAVRDALVLPDALLRSVSFFYGSEGAPELGSGFGCTSVIWNSGPTAVLHGRNLDYDGVGYWDRNQVILHVLPRDGLAHVALTAMGVHATGITGFNEAGLSLAIHQLTFDDSQSAGTPMAVISAEVLRKARTIDDAIFIIKSFPRAGGWAYVLSHGRDRAVVEASASEVAIRRSSAAFFYQTNHVSSPALAKHQIFYTPGSWIDSHDRADTLKAFAPEARRLGNATPRILARLLGDRSRTLEGARVAGGTVAKLDNIQSVMMDPLRRTLWVAVGGDSKAPNENRYVSYKWKDLRSPERPTVGAENLELPQGLSPGGASGTSLRRLLRAASDEKAKRTGHRRELLARYRRTVEAEAAPAPGTWAGLYLYVWEELKHSAESERTEARAVDLLAALDLALGDPDIAGASMADRHRHSMGKLFRGRLLDLAARRGEALFEYLSIEKSAPFERVREAARKGIRNPFTWKQASRLAIDWPGIDLYSY